MKRWSGEKLFACDVRLKVFLESANLKDYDDRVHRETFHLQHVRKTNAELGALEMS